MTKRKTRRYKKKVQKAQQKKTKVFPKYKILTTTEYPLVRKTEYANNIKSAIIKAKRNSISLLKRLGGYQNTHTQIYYYSPRLKKYKRMNHQFYTGYIRVHEIWGKESYHVRRK